MIYTYSNLGTNGAAGNQLWEIAGTVGAAERNGGMVRLPDWYYRKYFNIPDKYFEPFTGESVDLSPDYCQDMTLWDHNTISEIFSFSGLAWHEVLKRHNDVLLKDEELAAVHVRRGNNLQLPDHHPVCSLDYFEEALYSLENVDTVVVFSDDIEWCKKQNLFKDAYFAEGNDPSVNIYDLTGPAPLSLDSVMIDLAFMAQCERHVISNSSFSWWGAYLAYGYETIYPKRWYGKALQHVDISNMFPDNWKAL